jgi:hypothetical protein
LCHAIFIVLFFYKLGKHTFTIIAMRKQRKNLLSDDSPVYFFLSSLLCPIFIVLMFLRVEKRGGQALLFLESLSTSLLDS